MTLIRSIMAHNPNKHFVQLQLLPPWFSLIDYVQMLSHGSADLILEACTDFWDGTDIYPLSGSDRCRNIYTPSIFVSVFPFAFLFFASLATLLLQKEGAGFLPAGLSVRLLLSICLQTHAGVFV